VALAARSDFSVLAFNASDLAAGPLYTLPPPAALPAGEPTT
jgi:hypothetical protein